MVMNLNILMLGTAVVLILGSYIILSLSLYPAVNRRRSKLFFVSLFLAAQAAGAFYILIQEQPLISVF
jgi:hypothetical protein